MQIGGATSYLASAASLLPAKSPSASVSPDVSPDITRAAQAPLTAAQALADEQSASAREEADKPADSPANTEKSQRKDGEGDPQQQRLEQLEITKLASRDQEVRAHEQAHAAIGGRYASAPSYTYERGPDGKRYAVAGEVGIDTGPVANDPEATMAKMEVVIRAALAPAEPSAQDRQVAALAQAQKAEASVQLAQQQRAEAQAASEARVQNNEEDLTAAEEGEAVTPGQQNRPAPGLDLYRQMSGFQEAVPIVDLVA